MMDSQAMIHILKGLEEKLDGYCELTEEDRKCFQEVYAILEQWERGYGEWIYDENGLDWNLPAWKCSKCRQVNTMIPPYIQYPDRPAVPVDPYSWAGSKYCPNCGVRMKIKKRSATI